MTALGGLTKATVTPLEDLGKIGMQKSAPLVKGRLWWQKVWDAVDEGGVKRKG